MNTCLGGETEREAWSVRSETVDLEICQQGYRPVRELRESRKTWCFIHPPAASRKYLIQRDDAFMEVLLCAGR